MCDCEFDLLTEAKRIGRAHMICPKCGEDVSLIYFLAWEATQRDNDYQPDVEV
jgi:hypothetical protein